MISDTRIELLQDSIFLNETADYYIINESFFQDIKEAISGGKVNAINPMENFKKNKENFKTGISQLVSARDAKRIFNSSDTFFNSILKLIPKTLDEFNVNNFFEKSNKILESYKIMMNTFSDIQVKEGFTSENVIKAIVLSAAVIVLNTSTLALFMLLLGPIAGTVSAITIFCPLIEEYAKNISIRENYKKEFFVIFNLMEFSLYMSRFYIAGVRGVANFIKLSIIRLIPVGMHAATTMIQDNIMKNKELQEIYGDNIKWVALFAGWFIHFVYNSSAI